MVPQNIEDYLRAYGEDLSRQILAKFPPLHSPSDPVSPILRSLHRNAFPAQKLCVMAAVKRLEQANSVALIGEMGTGKTLMAMSVAHVHAAGRPYAALVIMPANVLEKWARELLQTIPGAKVYIVDSLRSVRAGQTGHRGVNEVRLRNGRIIRDSFHTTLTEMRLRRGYKSALARWLAERGPGPHFLICGRDRCKLGAFWRHSYQIARCGIYNG